MSLLLPHYALARIRQSAIRIRNQRAIATTSHGHHSNPGKATYQPGVRLEELAPERGRKSGKGKCFGGLQSMDPEKQRDICKDGQAKLEAIQEYQEASREFGRDGSAHACHPWKSHEPPIVPPGYGEWKT